MLKNNSCTYTLSKRGILYFTRKIPSDFIHHDKQEYSAFLENEVVGFGKISSISSGSKTRRALVPFAHKNNLFGKHLLCLGMTRVVNETIRGSSITRTQNSAP